MFLVPSLFWILEKSMTDNARNKELIQEVTDKWWLVFLRGVVTIALGILLIANTKITITAVILILAIYWLTNGLVDVVQAILGWKKVDNYLWILLGGILQIVASLVIIIWPLFTTTAVTSLTIYLIAFVAMIVGGMALIRGMQMRKTEQKNEWLLLIGGVLAILYGVLVLFNPFPSVYILAIALGILSIIAGIMTIAFSLRLCKMSKALGEV